MGQISHARIVFPRRESPAAEPLIGYGGGFRAGFTMTYRVIITIAKANRTASTQHVPVLLQRCNLFL